MNNLKIGLIQMKVHNDKKENLLRAANLIKKISSEKSDIVILPEMFSCPYITSNFPIYAEEEGGYSYNFLIDNLTSLVKNNTYQDYKLYSMKINLYLILAYNPIHSNFLQTI